MKKRRLCFLFSVILAFTLTLTGCHTARKAAKNTGEISLKGEKLTHNKLAEAIEASHLDYQTLSARLSVDYKHKKDNFSNITILLRMQKDSAIWASVRPILGVELYRLMVTKDSIKLKDNLKNKVIAKSVREANGILPVSFDFTTLQNILLGNPTLNTGEIKDIETRGDVISATVSSSPFPAEFNWNAAPFHLIKSIWKISDTGEAVQEYDGYQQVDIGSFATGRNIRIEEKDPITLGIQFSKTTFNQALEFPF